MSSRRLALAALLLGALACQPSVPGSSNPAYVDYASFDPAAGDIPLPNDLALATAAPGSAQGEFLLSLATNGCPAGQAFPACGGFPNDSALPIAANFQRVPVGGGAPGVVPLDVSAGAIKWCPGVGCNLSILRVDGALPEALGADQVDVSYAGGTLFLANKVLAPGAPWPSGARYVVALRAGASGLLTTDGGWVNPAPTMWLLLQDKNLGLPENQSLLPGATPEERAAVGAQLEYLRQLYASPQGGAPLSVFGLVDSQFPHREIAVLTTFNIVSGTHVVVDEAAGILPLPSDFLLDPATLGARVRNIPAFGALAAGIATLDGFSTTGMIMAPTSGPIAAASVDVADPATQSVFLYKLTASGPVKVYDLVEGLLSGGTKPPTYLAQPPPIVDPATQASLLVALQPAVPVPTLGGVVPLPPLEEATTYAVVVTRRVQDCPGSPPDCTAGHDLIRNSAAHLLTISLPIYSAGHSTVAGVPDATAQALEPMRAALQPVYAALPAPLTRQDVAMAYTIRTQSITGVALLLGAGPYQQVSGVDVFPRAPDPFPPPVTTILAPDQAGWKYGVPTSGGLLASVDHFVDTVIATFDKLDPATGAFLADPSAGALTLIPALVAIPAGTAPLDGWPLAVFHHGLGRGRADMMLIAGALASGGIASAAIDADKHGDRSWCRVDADCAAGATCDHAAFGNQGDVACPPGSPPGCTPPDFLPGLCTAGLAYEPVTVLPACATPPSGDCWDGTGGIALSSGSFLVSGNFFRWRDTVRQDILDQSMLVRVLTTPEGQAVLGAAIDPTRVYYVGQSLGSFEGTLDLAANPRFSRAVLNVGGGTWVDVGTTSPAFAPLVDGLLAGLGITPGTAEYLQFLHVAKWVLDPADPVNFARHLVTDPLPNLLQGGVQAPKAVLGQAARCDSVVPNLTNQELYGLAGLAPLDPLAAPSTGVTLQWFMADTTTACPADGSTGAGGASHGFLLDFANQSLTGQAQASAVGFLLGVPPPPSTPVIP